MKGLGAKYVVLLATAYFIPGVKTGETITFLTQPGNVHVDINGTAQFACIYEGSQRFPTWKINGFEYSFPARLPSNHQIDTTGSYLTIHNVDPSLDGNTYQCIINSCYSDIGHLHVLSAYSEALDSKRTFIMRALTEVSSVDKAYSTEESQLMHFSKVMSTTSVLLNISKSNRDKEVPFISVVLSSTIPLLGVITLAIITGFGIYIKIRHSPNKLKNKVESPETDLSRNEAYETITIKPNNAYESVLKTKI